MELPFLQLVAMILAQYPHTLTHTLGHNEPCFFFFNSPTEDHDEVHDVPPVPEVRSFMKHEAQGYDFYPGFKTEHSNEVGLRLLLHTLRDGRSDD